jgi:iron complex outermembrane receptor protein
VRQVNDDPIDQTTGNPVVGGPGTLLAVSAPYVNGPSTKTNGIDIDLRQRFTLGEFGKLTANLTWSHVNSFKRTLEDGSVREYAGTYGPHFAQQFLRHAQGQGHVQPDAGSRTLVGNGHRELRIRFEERGVSGRSRRLSLDIRRRNRCAGRLQRRVIHHVRLDREIRRDEELSGLRFSAQLFDRVAPYDKSAFYGTTHYNATYNQIGALGRTYNVGLKYTF